MPGVCLFHVPTAMTHTHHPYGELQNYICYIMLHLWLSLVSVFTAAMIDIDGIM